MLKGCAACGGGRRGTARLVAERKAVGPGTVSPVTMVGAEQRRGAEDAVLVIGVDVRKEEEEEEEVRSRLVEGHLDVSKARCDSRRLLLLSRQVDQRGLHARLEDGMTIAVGTESDPLHDTKTHTK